VLKKVNLVVSSKTFVNTIFLFLLFRYILVFQDLIKLNTDNNGDLFITADWLINFNHGFVRRGILGSLFVNDILNAYTGLLLLSFFQIGIYLFIIYKLYIYFLRINQNLLSIAILLNPIFLIYFSLNDFRGSFRKEILGFTALLLVLELKSKEKNKFLLIQIIYLIAIFSSEMNLLFYPALMYIFFVNIQEKSLVRINQIILTATSSIYVLMYLFTRNNYQEIENNICNELLSKNFNKNICEGSISFIHSSAGEYFTVSNSYYNNDYFYFYGLAIFIASIPVSIFKLNKTESIFHISNFFFFVPFLIISMDWGRILSIYFSIVYLIYITSNKKNIKSNSFFEVSVILITIFFNFIWKVQHCCIGFDFYDTESILWNLIKFGYGFYLN